MTDRDENCAPVPDTAMATGNDDGEPGPDPAGPLTADERALLEELTHDESAPVVQAGEDSPAVRRAVEDDSVVPGDA